MMNLSQKPEDDQWSHCPAGEVGGLVDRLHRRRRREQLRQAAAGVACVAVVLMAGYVAIPRLGLDNASHGGVVCADVHRMAGDYVAGRLDAETQARIDAHLKRCAPCRDVVANLRDSQATLPADSVKIVRSPRQEHRPILDARRTDLVAMSRGSL